MDGWREDGLGQQRHDSGGCRSEWKALVYMQMIEFHMPVPVFFRTAFSRSGGLSPVDGPLHDVVGVSCKRAQLLKLKAQVSSIWAKGCMLEDCVCVCDLT